MPIEDETPDGYSRAFFPLWEDADGDGCNTREEVLLAQAASPPSIRGNCELSGGQWFSEYDGLMIDDPAAVEVDHVVPLAEAWASGARAWTTAKRQRYANDLGVVWALIAVSSHVNQVKGDRDPTEWLPARLADRCPYIAAWIGVKARWDLSIDEEESLTLKDVIRDCPNTRLVLPAAS